MKITRTTIGYILFAMACLALLVECYFITDSNTQKTINFFAIIAIVCSLLLIFQFANILFDNHEWVPNTELKQLIRKIRLRGVLFNNLSVMIFIMIILIIITGFYILIDPSFNKHTTPNAQDVITIRISATALLIFLVQILFRAFKYLLRVAAFYNGKADALEANKLITGSDLEKLMDMFTPDKYDISDVPTPSFLDKLGGK